MKDLEKRLLSILSDRAISYLEAETLWTLSGADTQKEFSDAVNHLWLAGHVQFLHGKYVCLTSKGSAVAITLQRGDA